MGLTNPSFFYFLIITGGVKMVKCTLSYDRDELTIFLSQSPSEELKNKYLKMVPFIGIVHVLKEYDDDYIVYDPLYYVNAIDKSYNFGDFEVTISGSSILKDKHFVGDREITIGEIKKDLHYEDFDLYNIYQYNHEFHFIRILTKYFPEYYPLHRITFKRWYIASLYILGLNFFEQYINKKQEDIIIDSFKALKDFFEIIGYKNYEFAIKNTLRYYYIKGDKILIKNIAEKTYKELFNDDIRNYYISLQDYSHTKNGAYFILYYLLHHKNGLSFENKTKINYFLKNSHIPIRKKYDNDTYVLHNQYTLYEIDKINIDVIFKNIITELKSKMPKQLYKKSIKRVFNEIFGSKLYSYFNPLLIDVEINSKVTFNELPIDKKDYTVEDKIDIFYRVLIKYKDKSENINHLYNYLNKLFDNIIDKVKEKEYTDDSIYNYIPITYLKEHFDEILTKLLRKKTSIMHYRSLLQKMATVDKEKLSEYDIIKVVLF